MWLFWLIVAVVFSVAEIFYNGFFLIWFAAGAFCAIITSFLTDNIVYQSIVFLVISLVLLLTLTKRFTNRLTAHSSTLTNLDSLIGKKGIVTQTIGEDHFENGLVKLDGEIWTAVSKDGQFIEKGTIVQIHEIRGVRLIVSPAEN